MVMIGNDWDEILKGEFDKPYYKILRMFLVKEYREKEIYPDMSNIFNALKFTAYKDVKVVLIGQDPYHGPKQAHGLSFSVQDGIPLPPSLQNIFKELNSDLGISIPTSGNLTRWAKQGVMLLNTVLTVEKSQPNSHKNKGWEFFTDHIIKLINEKEEPVVFLLWGNNAKEKRKLITNIKHLVLEASHPSPFSAYNGFMGCKHFSKTNEFLKKNKIEPINW